MYYPIYLTSMFFTNQVHGFIIAILKHQLPELTTILEGVSSRARVPRTGVAGALPLLHAFSYDVSGRGEKGRLKLKPFYNRYY
jgi:hypothetical protein